MAFTVSDFEDLVRLLGEHPEWRDRLRPVILGDEILQIPSRMDRVEAALQQVAETLRTLVERMDAFEIRMDRTDGRLGNIEDELLEHKYGRHVASWFSRWLRRAHELSAEELEEIFDAAAANNVPIEDLKAVHHSDLIVRGIDREHGANEPVTLAVEISYTINSEDITRASTRASVLERVGFRTRGFVGGYRATPEVKRLADKLNVILDLHRPPAA